MRLTSRHKLAALLLAQGELKVSEVAEKIQRGRRTLYLWLADPQFASQVAEYQDGIVKSAMRHQRAHVLEAATRITEIMRAGPTIQALTAAQDILDRVLGKGVQPIEHRDGPKVLEIPTPSKE